jgi:hypothetical protein
MITVRQLIDRAAELTGVTVAQIYGPSHKRYICAVRCAVYVVAHENGVALNQIGRRVARHHTSVMNAVRNQQVYEQHYPQTTRLIEALRTGKDIECRFVALPTPPKPKPKQKFYTPERMEQIDAMVQEGVNMMDIADRIGKTYSSVKDARNLWLKKHPDRKQKREWPDGRLEKVLRLRQTGMLWKDIGKVMGIASETLRHGVIRAAPQSRPQSIPRSGSDRPDRRCHPT